MTTAVSPGGGDVGSLPPLGDGGVGSGGGFTAVGEVPSVGMLAVTGVGPGTAVLAVAGMVSLVAGGVAVLLGRRPSSPNDPTSPLADISHLAVDP
jgi:predicted phage tail protein